MEQHLVGRRRNVLRVRRVGEDRGQFGVRRQREAEVVGADGLTFTEIDSFVDAGGGQYAVISKQTIAGRRSQTIYFPRIAAYRFEKDARRSVLSLSQLLHKINT